MSKVHIYSQIPKEPQNWFRGIISKEPYLPYNILIFTRQQKDLCSDHIDFHHRFVLITSLRGSGTLLIDWKKITIEKGTSLVIFPFQYHRYIKLDNNIFWLYITFDIKDASRYEPLRFFPIPITSPERILLEEITKSYLHSLKNETNNHTCAFLLGAYLEKMLGTVSKTRKKATKYPSLPTSNEIVQKSCRFIYDNMNKQLTAKQVAKFVNSSVSSLQAIFKKICNVGIGSYIARVKLCHASVLLHNTNLAIKTIAAECGYLSVSSFIRSFKKTAGVTPADYRKKKSLFANIHDMGIKFPEEA